MCIRLDEQEVTIETRRQAERTLQKVKEKEKDGINKIADEEKRISSIHMAKKHWTTLKKEHKSLTRRNSQSSSGSKLILKSLFIYC